jgi:hypothetical protein
MDFIGWHRCAFCKLDREGRSLGALWCPGDLHSLSSTFALFDCELKSNIYHQGGDSSERVWGEHGRQKYRMDEKGDSSPCCHSKCDLQQVPKFTWLLGLCNECAPMACAFLNVRKKSLRPGGWLCPVFTSPVFCKGWIFQALQLVWNYCFFKISPSYLMGRQLCL